MCKPNIIFILTDHFRRDVLHPRLTPNLKKLAAGGVTFSNAYSASPICQPARNCIITGMHAGDNDICGNQQPPLAENLRRDTFMNHLRSAGYYTALIGKHHYIDRYGLGIDVTKDEDAIKSYGFDRVIQVVDDGENQHNDCDYTRFLKEKGKLAEFREALASRSSVHPFEPDDTADGFIGMNGVRFIEEYALGEKPFYLNLSFIGPHPPFWHPGTETPEPGEILKPPKMMKNSEEANKKRAHYLAKCALIDRYVGKLSETLVKKKLMEKTVIIFTSDHGDMLGDRGIWGKRHFYEESVGVPLFICGGGVPSKERNNAPRISRGLVSHVDLYPTILEIAGAIAPRNRKRRGISIFRLFDEKASAHSLVLAELASAVMVRTENWKMVYDAEAGGVQHLYNLISDPEEINNLAGAAGYGLVTSKLIEKILEEKILRTQNTHIKEEQLLQRVRVSGK